MSDYLPKNILITGGSGFIGSAAVLHFVKKYPNIKMVNLDILDYCSRIENLDEIKDFPNYKFVKGDILSADLVNYIIETEKIDTILHLASQTHVCNSFGNSIKFTQTNVLGIHVLLEAAKYHNIKRFLNFSTDEVMGEDRVGVPMNEESILNPSNPYASSKASAELIAKSYYHSFKLPLITTRSNNCFGPRQFVEKLIPKFINRLFRGLPLTLHGDGLCMRNFLYVEDTVSALDLLVFKGEVGQTYNIGGNNEFTNLEVAKKLLKLMGYEGKEDEMITFVEDRHFNDYRYNIDDLKLRKLGWTPKIEFEDGLKKTIEWYKEFGHRYGNIDDYLLAHPKI